MEQAGSAGDVEADPERDARWSQVFWCIFYGSGIIGTLVIYGLLQERIMTIPYSGEMFGVSAFLVLCNRIVNCVYAATMITAYEEDFTNGAPLWKYLVISLSNVAATTCQYESLKYVSFPVQMLGKSFKMMPVMVWGILISGKKYTLLDWAVGTAVTLGVTEFCMTGPLSSPNNGSGSSFYGFLLLACFLACDGLTSTMQEKLFKENNTSKFNQMLYVNGFSALVSFGIVLSMGKMSYCLSFVSAHGTFALDAGMLSASAAGSQYFIYSQVKEYGALVFAATMNVRQIVSILVSYVTYHHSITLLQFFGLLVIFSALFYKSYVSLMAEKQEEEPLIKKSQADEPAESKPMSA